jgi:tetratricopeptide (TPR) repeat protein
MYTSAIEAYSEDSVFYSNRSQCYIYLEKFTDAVQDAEKAIELDSGVAKPYFRCITAYEKLDEDMKALQSCQQWMSMLPNDQLAKTTYDRIHNKIIEKNKQKEKEKIKWSRLSRKGHFIEKSSHLRSNKQLNKVPIRIKKSHSPIPDDIIDKLFNNNTGESFREKETDSKLFKSNFLTKPTPVKSSCPNQKEKTKVNETNEILKASSSPNDKCKSETTLSTMEEMDKLWNDSKNFSLPTSGPQFYQTWKELSENLRFMYLKSISECHPSLPLGTLVGAQLDSTLLSELIQVIHKYFLHFKIPYIPLLSELSKNSELTILSLFLDIDDKTSKLKIALQNN